MKKIFHELLDFAVETAHEAGKITLKYFRAGVQAEFKTDDTPITIADHEAEKAIRARIEKKYPTHAICGEEFGDAGDEKASHRWFIDPIDGTKVFMRGVPLYGVLIGLEIEGRVEVGAAYFPALDEMVYAATGTGCFWNGRPAQVSQTQTIDRAFVSFTDPGTFEEFDRGEEWARIQKAVYHRVGWSDAYGHALVAIGATDVMLDPIMNPWDCGPFPVILREAGGYFGDWCGNETIYASEALSTTRRLLPDVLRVLDGNMNASSDRANIK